MASLEKPRKLEDTVGKMRTLREGTVGKRRKRSEKRHEMAERNIVASILKKTQVPKLNGEQRPLRLGERQFARG